MTRNPTHRETTFHDALVVGQRVRYSCEGVNWSSTGSGVYLGVALDEQDGVPYHYFRDGEINGHAQTSHGFPAGPGTPTTTELTPTELITGDRAVLVRRGEVHELRLDADGNVLCPMCGHNDVAMWADDGESDAADWWECETFSGGCGTDGAVCLASNVTRTQNGEGVAP